MDRPDSAGISRQALLAVFFTALAVYLSSLFNGFVWDDISHIVDPGPLQSLGNIPVFFKTAVTSGASFGDTVPYYRPLSTLSLALDYALWGANPLGFHLTNILLHGLVALLVTLLAFELLRNRSGALAAGLLFAVHPVHAEAVAYVATRNELLCTLFALGAFFIWCRCREKRPWYLWPLVLTLFFASLLSKEMTITLPALIFLCEILCYRSGFLRGLLRTIPFVLTAGLFLALRSAALVITSWESPPFGVRLSTAVTLLGEYFRLLVAPWPLRVLHDLPVRWSFTEPGVLVWGFLLIGLLVLLVYSCRNYPLFSFGGAWIILTLLPVSGLPAFIQPALIAERYLYFPSAGLAILVGLILISLQRQEWYCSRQRLFKAAGGALLVCCGIAAGWQSRAWHDQEQFCLRMIADAPGHPLGYHELGNWYGKQQRYTEMAAAYQASLALTMQRQDLTGRAYLGRGEFPAAERAYMKLVNAKVTSGPIYNNLGQALLGQGKQAEATVRFRQALELEPDNMEFRKNLERSLSGGRL